MLRSSARAIRRLIARLSPSGWGGDGYDDLSPRENEMTAYPHEYDFIKREGVRFSFLTQPVRLLAENGRVKALECVRVSLGGKDASGRPAPQPVAVQLYVGGGPGCESDRQQKPSLISKLGLKTDKGFIHVDGNFETSLRSVCRRRLHTRARSGLHRDGGAGWKNSRRARFRKSWKHMADLRINFAGIRSPNPFWLASAPPTNSGAQVHRALEAGWEAWCGRR